MPPRIPIELSNARNARTEAWSKYMDAVESHQPKDTIDELYKVTQIMEDHVKAIYNSWQALGGTSNIESVTIKADIADIMRWNDWQDEQDTIKSIRADFHI